MHYILVPPNDVIRTFREPVQHVADGSYVSGKKFIQYIDESHTVPVNHRCIYKTLMTVLLIRCSRKRFWYLYAQCS